MSKRSKLLLSMCNHKTVKGTIIVDWSYLKILFYLILYILYIILSYLNLENTVESESESSSISVNYDYSSDEFYIPPTKNIQSEESSDDDILNNNGR